MNSTEIKDFLGEIKDWKLEAADEDNKRYFYPVHGISDVQKGRLSYVIGRKGSGKTAIAEHLLSLAGERVFVVNLSFKNFPFNDIYRLSDDGYTRPSQYTTIWKYITYLAVCGMMAKSPFVDARVASQLRTHFGIDIERALARTLSRIPSHGGFRIGLDPGFEIPNDASLMEKTDILEDIVKTYIDDSAYYILFDELDEDYKDVFVEEQSAEYKDLLIGLFKATHDIRRKMNGKKVQPVVFLRKDIYEQLRDNDKNKWEDSALQLSWTEGQLQQLIAFRISRAIRRDGQIMHFSEAFKALFTTDVTRAGGGSSRRPRRHIFRYILVRTLMRPRDVISFIRECAGVALDQQAHRVSTEMLSAAELKYSSRLRKEFIDEIQAAVPYIDEIFNVMSKQRKQIFRLNEFEVRYNALRGRIPKGFSFDFPAVCNILFHYSVIGNQPNQKSAKIFKYIHSEASINMSENVLIHIGLLKSLQIN